MTTNRTLRISLLALVFAAVTSPAFAGDEVDLPPLPATSVDGAKSPDAGEGLVPDLRGQILRSAPTIALFATASLVPAAILMVTAFVRINIVLTLLRQALGSPQVPGNQVLMGLALLLTAIVMKPQAEVVYRDGIQPFASGRLGPAEAWEAGTQPIKVFMVKQIEKTHHFHYLEELYAQAEPDRPLPEYAEHLPLRVVAPAFLLSELTTALVIGFAIFLPFLVIDLVVSAVLAAMGLVMLPPSLVSLPLKLIVFVLADGWMLVAGMLLRSFA